MKTNTKQAKKNIKKYILENTTQPSELGYDPSKYADFNESDFSTCAKYIWGCYWEQVGKYDNKRNMDIQDSFVYWLGGLPNELDTCYLYNRSAVKDLGDILEQSEEERNKYTEQQSEQILSRLIYREIRQAINE